MRRLYNDDYRGWPVAPRNRQHPIRGAFLDPRPKDNYHHGVDVSVRDDKPDKDAPPGRSHKVYAVEGGRVWRVIKPARRPGAEGIVRVGHFGYGHVDPVVALGELVRPGQLIAWTVRKGWHVHLTEWHFPGRDLDRRVPVNPLSRNGKLAPYVDLFPPVVRDIRFYTPASPPWRNSLGRAIFPDAGFPLDPHRLSGLVDVRARIEDRVSFLGWFTDRPILQTPHHPARVHVTLIRLTDLKRLVDRDVFKAEATLGPESATPVPFSHHFAPGTKQNLRAQDAVRLARNGSGQLWFRLFARPEGAYWDTTLLRNGRYRIKIQAWDVVGNRTADRIDVVVKN